MSDGARQANRTQCSVTVEVRVDAAAALALQQTLQAQIRKLKFAKYHANSLRQDSLQQHCK